MTITGIITLLLRSHIPNAKGFGSAATHDSYHDPVRLLIGVIFSCVIVFILGSFLLVPGTRLPGTNIVVTQAWSRATPHGSTVAGGYLTIENKGSAAERLLSASTPVAKKIEIHEMAVTDGIMTMRPIEDGLSIKSGDTVKFLPGGLHLMIIGLNGPLVQGDKVSVTLRFEKAGEIVVSFDVRAMGAPAPGPLSNAADPTFHSPAKM